MVQLRGRSGWRAPDPETRVELPEPDYDPGPTLADPDLMDELGAEVEDRDERIADLEAALGTLKHLVEWAPFHTYCEWRTSGDQKAADKLDDWQIARDAAVARAGELLAESVSS